MLSPDVDILVNLEYFVEGRIEKNMIVVDLYACVVVLPDFVLGRLVSMLSLSQARLLYEPGFALFTFSNQALEMNPRFQSCLARPLIAPVDTGVSPAA